MFSLVPSQRRHRQTNQQGRIRKDSDGGYRRRLFAERLEDRRVLAQTVGVFVNEPGAFDGYTLFSPELVHRTYLIDNAGNQVHAWPSDYDAANMTYLEPDGSIWRTGSLELSNVWPWNSAGVGGIVQQIDWDGRVVAEFRLAEGTGNPDKDSRILHHDIEVLPNGNVAMIAFDYVSQERAENNGRDPALLAAAKENDRHLLPDSIIEVAFDNRGRGTIVWEWHAEDHFVQDRFADKLNYAGAGKTVADYPGKIDINYVHPNVGPQADMTHANGLEYIPELDQFILSVRSFSEIWVIDHNTVWDPANNINEPAGPKGDLLYRWGNPAAYGQPGAQQSFFQHDPLWVPSDYDAVANPGSITLYSNGHVQAGPFYSAVENIVPPIVYNSDGSFNRYQLTPDLYQPGVAAWGPVTRGADWKTLAKFSDPATSPLQSGDRINFSAIISGAERMPNGNTLITEGVTGTIFEVTPDNQLVWEYVNPVVPGGTIKQGDPVPLVDFFPPQLNTHTNFIFKSRRYDRNYLDKRLDPEPGDTAGLFDPGKSIWYLNNRSDGSIYDLIVLQDDLTRKSFLPISGDWDGDGVDTVGLYDKNSNTWYLNNSTRGDLNDVVVLQGAPVDPSLRPIAGDWDGPDKNGVRRDMPGLYDWRTNTWHLYTGYDVKNPSVFQASAITFSGPNHRQSSWRPIAGDWDGDGLDTVGLYVPSSNIWYLNNEIDGSIDDLLVAYGPRHNRPDWRPIAGDWDLNGVDSIGLYVPGSNIWYLNNRNDGSISDLIAFQGPLVPTNWQPIVGNWNGSQAGEGEAPRVVAAAAASEAGVAAPPFGIDRINFVETDFGQAVPSAGALDANGDGNITALDALVVINALNARVAGFDGESTFYPDVNGDMLLSPIDALIVINHLNQGALREGPTNVAPFAAYGVISLGPDLPSQETTFATDSSPSNVATEPTNADVDVRQSTMLQGPVLASFPSTARSTLTHRSLTECEEPLEVALDAVAEEIAIAWASA